MVELGIRLSKAQTLLTKQFGPDAAQILQDIIETNPEIDVEDEDNDS